MESLLITFIHLYAAALCFFALDLHHEEKYKIQGSLSAWTYTAYKYKLQ